VALADRNAFQVSLRREQDRPLLDELKVKVKKAEGLDLTDAGMIRRALGEMKKRLDREAKR
jgi:hypothetical protein